MQPRPGFARLLPFTVLAGLVAGTLALLASARPVQAPEPERVVFFACRESSLTQDFLAAGARNGGCSDAPTPVPPSGIRDVRGKAWSLCDLQPGAVLDGADLRRAQWAGVGLRGVTFRRCRLDEADLTGVDLTGCRFVRCDLLEACLEHARLARSTWVDVNLYDGSLHSADLRGATLTRVDLCDCSLWEARLNGADLTRCYAERVEPGGSCYDRFTRWPVGFDPKAHGARLED
jgi:hypothetical protein